MNGSGAPVPYWNRRVAALSLLAAALACGEPRLRVYVSFPGPVDIQTCADVRYQGVVVGSVRSIELAQAGPDEPAAVVLELGITDETITLREADAFTIASDGFFGDDYIAIAAAPARSPPLPPGASVAGTPPVLTQLSESASSALEWVNSLAQDKKDALLEALGQSTQPSEP